MSSLIRRAGVFGLLFWALGCSDPADEAPGSGGVPAAGGVATTGGATSTGSGGTIASGGATASGGSIGSGGVTSSGGGQVSAGGVVATGGTTATGGMTASGGMTATGGGGMTSTGGGDSGGTTSGAGGGSAGNGGGAGESAGGSMGGSGGASGAGGGGSGAGGATGGTSTGGTPPTCNNATGTSTRPQLSSSEAANFTILKYFAQPDAWDPTAGLGNASSFTPDYTVAGDGSGTHTSVQAALSALSGSTRRYILIKPGTYSEIVSYSGSTPVTLYGASTDATEAVLSSSRSANDAGGTSASAIVTIKSAGLQMMNLTVSNTFATPSSGSGLQAVALYTTGDKTVLQNIRLHGFQDTFYVDSPSATTVSRVYIKDSHIEGDTDYIFGRATAVFDGCTLQYLSSRKGTGSGVYAAPSTSVGNDYGFLFIGCDFSADGTAPSNKISLARSWDQSSTTPTPNGQVVVRESTLGGHINKTSPWAAAATSGREYSATGNRFNEYCNSGPGAAP